MDYISDDLFLQHHSENLKSDGKMGLFWIPSHFILFVTRVISPLYVLLGLYYWLRQYFS